MHNLNCEKKKLKNMGYFCKFKKRAQSKQSPKWAKIRPMGSLCSRETRSCVAERVKFYRIGSWRQPLSIGEDFGYFDADGTLADDIDLAVGVHATTAVALL
jgi:hypothetical protein